MNRKKKRKYHRRTLSEKLNAKVWAKQQETLRASVIEVLANPAVTMEELSGLVDDLKKKGLWNAVKNITTDEILKARAS